MYKTMAPATNRTEASKPSESPIAEIWPESSDKAGKT